jgi:hypothetical protein
MAPPKIERQTAKALPKTDRSAPAKATLKIAPLPPGRTPPPSAAAFVKGGARAQVNAGTHVATSAQPEALWGGNSERAQIAALSPEKRAEKLTELQGQRDALQAKIITKVAELDTKFANAPTATKTRALREYVQSSQHLDASTKAEIHKMVEQAERCEKRIERLQQRQAGLGPAKGASVEMKRKRAELSAELRAARNEETSSVKHAIRVIDAKGLKVDRLAVTQQVIDPKAPKKEDGDSLWGMVKKFFALSQLCSWVYELVEKRMADREEEKHTREREEALQKDIEKQQIDQQQFQQRLVNQRELLKQLAASIASKS